MARAQGAVTARAQVDAHARAPMARRVQVHKRWAAPYAASTTEAALAAVAGAVHELADVVPGRTQMRKDKSTRRRENVAVALGTAAVATQVEAEARPVE